VKQRAVTLLLALAALVLFYALLFPKPIAMLQPASSPLSTDSGDDGLLAIWRWLQAESIPVTSLRGRYDRLESVASAGAGAGSGGNVLISVLPHRLAVRAQEWQPLTHWVEQGNTLLVLAALDDTPRWTLGSESDVLDSLQRATHLKFQAQAVPKDKASQAQQVRDGLSALLGPTIIPIIPLGTHPLTAEVHNLRAESDLPAARWRAQPTDAVLALALAQRADNLDSALWISRQGEGQIIVFAVTSAFANRQIALANNARLLSNIISWSRAPQGRVLFDDAHQGLVDFYDPQAFYHDPRLHRTLLWSVLLWLAFVLGPVRLASAYRPWRPVDESALIDASGRFFSVSVAPLEAARRLFENFFDQLRRRLALPENGEPLWEWLDAQAGLSERERALLRDWYTRVYAGERVELTRLHNLLSEIRGKLA
jgi:Domain of unknown function (DUF4350)